MPTTIAFTSCACLQPGQAQTAWRDIARALFHEFMACAPQQMDFLRHQLSHERQYTLICGGPTLTCSAENWSNYSAKFAEFRQLVQGAHKLLGDIHKNAFKAPAPSGVPPCYEIISSGLCVNYLGLPFEFDRRRNWTLLTLDAQQVLIDQHDKHGITRWRIDAASWQNQALGRELRPA